MRVLAAPDKFRGTATANEVVGAIAAGAKQAGATFDGIGLADGGEGLLESFGGPNRESVVTGPNGDAVTAGWRLDGKTAVVEMALASGLDLAGGIEANDPMGASTFGTGELVDQAIQRGARRVVVGLGGSATTDGGLGALRALHPIQRLRGVELLVACDVTTRFVDAASVFGPQKGATPAQVELLGRRLETLVEMYSQDFGVDVSELVGGGAAGGLAGGLAAVGATLMPGFDLVADELDLATAIESADLVVTGEGVLDEQSLKGKVVGGVIELSSEFEVPVLVVCGESEIDDPPGVSVVALAERFGGERSWANTTECVTEAVAEFLQDFA